MQVAIVVMAIALYTVGPLAAIWALNALGLHTPYTLATWLAMLILSATFGNTKVHFKF